MTKPISFWLGIFAFLAATRASGDTKTQYYVVDAAGTFSSTQPFSVVVAYCSSANDIIVGGGCWGSTAMVALVSYPHLGAGSTASSYVCGLNGVPNGTTLHARAVCKTPGTDSKSNYHAVSVTTNLGTSTPSGLYYAQAFCPSSDALISGGSYAQYGYTPALGGISALTSQYPQLNGTGVGAQDYWLGQAYYTNGGRVATDSITAVAICKTNGNKNDYEMGDATLSWGSPSDPEALQKGCPSGASSMVLSGGCWGSGIGSNNTTYPQPNGAGNVDYFQCAVHPQNSGQLGARVLCRK